MATLHTDSDTALIHPTAIIEPGAQIDAGVTIGAYAYIGSQVSIKKGTIVHHHATVDGLTFLGENNEIFPYAFIGGKTHDLKYTGGQPGLKIGNNNVFREYVTVHTATKANEWTVLGSHNTILAYSHIAHDCQVGNHLVMSSNSALAGHVIVEDHVTIGWNAGVHQFCNIGKYAMLGACSKIVQSVLPFMLADGNPASIRTFNKIGLERAGYSKEDVDHIRHLFTLIYKSGANKSQAFEEIERLHGQSKHAQELLRFKNSIDRGLL